MAASGCKFLDTMGVRAGLPDTPAHVVLCIPPALNVPRWVPGVKGKLTPGALTDLDTKLFKEILVQMKSLVLTRSLCAVSHLVCLQPQAPRD